jgi:hypothetical protein
MKVNRSLAGRKLVYESFRYEAFALQWGAYYSLIVF